MNIANWILGIGDRHLMNIMMNKKTAKITGIDFNLSFGNATRHLPVPELIPFRLTPQIVSVNNPLGTEGLIKTCMTHAMRAFQLNREVLITYLEVFIKEPLMDWSLGGEISDENANERAQRQVEEISLKVNGINPIRIFENHLRNGYFVA